MTPQEKRVMLRIFRIAWLDIPMCVFMVLFQVTVAVLAFAGLFFILKGLSNA